MVFVENSNPIKVNISATSVASVNLTPQDQVVVGCLKQSSQALKSAAEPQKSGKTSTENNAPDESNPILEALFASIDANALIKKENAETIKVVLNAASSQLGAIQDLKKAMEDLNRELAGNLTPAQIAAIEAQLAKLESQCKNAKSQKDIDAAIAGIEALEKLYPSLKGALDTIIACMNNHKDPSAAFAALEASLNAMNREDTSLASQISNLQAQLSSLQASISSDMQKIEGLVLTFSDKNSHIKDLELLLSLRTLVADLSNVKIVDSSQKDKNLKGSEESVHYQKDLLETRKGVVES